METLAKQFVSELAAEQFRYKAIMFPSREQPEQILLVPEVRYSVKVVQQVLDNMTSRMQVKRLRWNGEEREQMKVPGRMAYDRWWKGQAKPGKNEL